MRKRWVTHRTLNAESYRRKKAASDKQARHDAAKAKRRRQPSENSDNLPPERQP
jgi:hypothetical protein